MKQMIFSRFFISIFFFSLFPISLLFVSFHYLHRSRYFCCNSLPTRCSIKYVKQQFMSIFFANLLFFFYSLLYSMQWLMKFYKYSIRVWECENMRALFVWIRAEWNFAVKYFGFGCTFACGSDTKNHSTTNNKLLIALYFYMRLPPPKSICTSVLLFLCVINCSALLLYFSRIVLIWREC